MAIYCCSILVRTPRGLLSVTTANFDTLKTNYVDLELGDFADYNIIEIGGAGDQAGGANNNFAFTLAGLQGALERAGETAEKDLIVIRTTASQNRIQLTGTELGKATVDPKKLA